MGCFYFAGKKFLVSKYLAGGVNYMDDLIKNMGLKKIDFDLTKQLEVLQKQQNLIPGLNIHNNTKQIEDAIRVKHKREEEYKNDVLEALRGIQKNTANLTEIVFLLKEGNVVKEELYELFIELFTILKASNEKEANNIYRKVMNNLTQLETDVNTINAFSNWGLILKNLMFPVTMS